MAKSKKIVPEEKVGKEKAKGAPPPFVKKKGKIK